MFNCKIIGPESCLVSAKKNSALALDYPYRHTRVTILVCAAGSVQLRIEKGNVAGKEKEVGFNNSARRMKDAISRGGSLALLCKAYHP